MGDTSQCDLRTNLLSGLQDAVRRLEGLEDVGLIQFEVEDVMRHPIIADILARYAAG